MQRITVTLLRIIFYSFEHFQASRQVELGSLSPVVTLHPLGLDRPAPSRALSERALLVIQRDRKQPLYYSTYRVQFQYLTNKTSS
jgi:hypothetical protein